MPGPIPAPFGVPALQRGSSNHQTASPHLPALTDGCPGEPSDKTRAPLPLRYVNPQVRVFIGFNSRFQKAVNATAARGHEEGGMRRALRAAAMARDADPSNSIPPTIAVRKQRKVNPEYTSVCIDVYNIYDLQIHISLLFARPRSQGKGAQPLLQGPRLPPATLYTLCQAGGGAAWQIFCKEKLAYSFPPPPRVSAHVELVCIPGRCSQVHESEWQGRGT